VLKKTGLVLSVATAALLAMSPLAFAGDKDDHHKDGHHEGRHHSESYDQVNSVDSGRSQVGLVNVGDTETNTQTQNCGNGMTSAPVATSAVTSTITDALAPLEPLLGVLAPEATDVSANGSSAEAATSTTVTCSQSGGTQDSISQSNEG
jgi:hypothetical protein